MKKVSYRCESCGNTWQGKPMEKRKDIRLKNGEPRARCPDCMSYAGVEAKTVSSPEGSETPKLKPETSLDDYSRLLKKARDGENLKQGLIDAVTGGDDDDSFDRLLKVYLIERMGQNDSDQFSREIQSLRSDLKKLKSSRFQNSDSASDKLLGKLVDGLDLKEALSGGSSDVDVASILDKFENRPPAQGEVGEFNARLQSAKAEADARKTEAEERRKGFEAIADSIRDAADRAGWSIGEAVARGSQSQNQSQTSQSPNQGVMKLDENLRGNCPGCGATIQFEEGKARARCPNCGMWLSRITREEEEEGVEA